MRIRNPQHRLELGPIDLIGRDPSDAEYRFELVADGFDRGSPEAVRAIVQSLWLDGDDERITRFGNRIVRFRVIISGPDQDVVADGERALALQIGGRNTLTWTPPDGYGESSVYDVLTSVMDPVQEPLADLRVERSFELTLTCRPWVRSATLSVATFAPGSVTPTTLDAGSATTNWSVIPGGSSAALSSMTWLSEAAIKVDTAAVGDGTVQQVLIRWTGTVPTSNYLAIDVAQPSGSYIGYNPANGPSYAGAAGAVLMNGVQASSVETLASGYQRFYFVNTGAVPNFEVWGSAYNSGGGLDFYIGGLYSTSAVGVGGLMIAAVGGSVRTVGSVKVTRAGSALQDLMIFSDPMMLSSGYNPGNASTWPLAPAGPYLFYLDVSSVSGLSTNDVFVLTVNGKTLRTRIEAGYVGQWLPIGKTNLGGRRDGRLGTLTLSLTKNGGAPISGAVFRMFRDTPDTALTYVTDGIFDLGNEVRVDIPSMEQPQGGVWGDGLDLMAKVTAWEYPTIAPPLAALFVADELSISAPTTHPLTVTLEHYATWMHNAGSVA